MALPLPTLPRYIKNILCTRAPSEHNKYIMYSSPPPHTTLSTEQFRNQQRYEKCVVTPPGHQINLVKAAIV
jgi:hypothetical protein